MAAVSPCSWVSAMGILWTKDDFLLPSVPHSPADSGPFVEAATVNNASDLSPQSLELSYLVNEVCSFKTPSLRYFLPLNLNLLCKNLISYFLPRPSWKWSLKSIVRSISICYRLPFQTCIHKQWFPPHSNLQQHHDFVDT